MLSSSCNRSGKIETSNTKINKLLENIYHSQESNFISVPIDCPQREKGGWTGDIQIYTPTAIFNMKIDNFMKRWLENMRVDQYENGQVPGLIPWIESDDLLSSGFGNISAAGWADACIIIPWNLYVQYEDINFLKDNYEMMNEFKSDLESPFEYCNLYYESIYGKIELASDLRENKNCFKIVVPIGATIVLKLPGREDKEFKSGVYEINME